MNQDKKYLFIFGGIVLIPFVILLLFNGWALISSIYFPEYNRYKINYDNTNFSLIKNIVTELNIPFIIDPSNQNTKYSRVAIRKYLNLNRKIRKEINKEFVIIRNNYFLYKLSPHIITSTLTSVVPWLTKSSFLAAP